MNIYLNKNNFKVEMKQVKSSNVISVGYDQNDLYVEYPGGIYCYSQVDKSVYENLLKSESKGRFMNMNVNGRYVYDRIILK